MARAALSACGLVYNRTVKNLAQTDRLFKPGSGYPLGRAFLRNFSRPVAIARAPRPGAVMTRRPCPAVPVLCIAAES